MSLHIDKKLLRRALFLVLAILLVFFTACTSLSSQATPTAAPIQLTDGLGRTVSLPAPAMRIVSLAPSNTEILFAIGAGSQVVGRDSFSDYPQEVSEITDVGGGFGEFNTEAILALKPDLVLAADIIPPEKIQALEDLGLIVFSIANPVDFEELFNNIQLVGKLTAHEEEAQKLISELKQRLQQVEEKVMLSSYLPLVFYELDASDPNAPWTAGPGTFIDTLITKAGGFNLGASLEGAWVQISLEVLIQKNPDIIILGDYTWGGVTPEAVAARAGWKVLKAVKENKVFTFDDNLVSRPGPRLVDGLEAMARLLHPELFE